MMDLSFAEKIGSYCDAELYAIHDKEAGPQVPILTVSRSYGAEGSEIARQLAIKLQVGFYDRELFEMVAEEAKADKQLVKMLDEHPVGPIDEVIYSIFGKKGVTKSDLLHHMVKIVNTICLSGGVIVGRGAHLLTGKKPLFRLRVEGSRTVCARRVMERTGVSEEKALALIEEKNNERNRFVRSIYKWYGAGRTFYDMVINTDFFTVPQAVRLVLRAMHRKGFKLPDTVLQEIGPEKLENNPGGTAVWHATSIRDSGLHYAPGEVIFEEGTTADRFFVIQEGQVELTARINGEPQRVGVLESGEILGVVSLFTQDKQQLYSARAVTDCRMLSVDEKLFVARLHSDPSLAFRVLRHMASHIRQDILQERALMESPTSREVVAVAEADGDYLMEPRRSEASLMAFISSHAGLRLLVVEDDGDYFELVRGWIESAARSQRNPLLPSRVEMVRAATLQESEEQLKGGRFSAVLLDLNLPDSQGLSTFNRLHQAYPGAPYLVLSGMDNENIALKAVEDGAEDYLVKHETDSRHLILAIRYAMERHARRGAEPPSAKRGGKKDQAA
ncbi:MAG: cytidylate kinase family protein [Magnetococcales bacterium]|nr:cytidylate kinase family protein [Magnetococcales bacterium]